jgi:toxin CcdB
VARQHDIYRTAEGTAVVIVQSDLLEAMRTRVVAPLLPEGVAGPSMRALNPVIAVGDVRLVLLPQLMATLTLEELGTRVGSAAPHADAITRAVDAMLSGV